jgi:hypothetical protein
MLVLLEKLNKKMGIIKSKRKKIVILDTLFSKNDSKSAYERGKKIVDVLFSCTTENQLYDAFTWAYKIKTHNDDWLSHIYNMRIEKIKKNE